MKSFVNQLLTNILVPVFILAISCSENNETKILEEKHLNITILIDLSDRITAKIAPFQIERDKELIKSILGVVKERIKKKGTFASNDKINFMFYPQPNSSNISSLASTLNFDLSRLEPQERKTLYQRMDSLYSVNLDKLYNLALASKSFDGADIWRFFKDEVKEKCIFDKADYSNVLIIFTDGYIYWKNTMFNQGNRFTYLLPTADHLVRFRSRTYWEEEFDKLDFGLIPAQRNLSNLKVLVLEVNPHNSHPEDYDIIKKYLSKWFSEMGITESNFKILKTDLPIYTKPIVESFITN